MENNKMNQYLSLLAYWIADVHSDRGGWLDNGDAVNFLRRMNGDEPLAGVQLTDETTGWFNRIQQKLRPLIEENPDVRTGGPEGRRGEWRITSQGRDKAFHLLSNLRDDEQD